MGNKEHESGMKKSDKEASREPKTGQRASMPGGEKNAAGKSNPNKQKEHGNIGSEPVSDKNIDRGE